MSPLGCPFSSVGHHTQVHTSSNNWILKKLKGIKVEYENIDITGEMWKGRGNRYDDSILLIFVISLIRSLLYW